MPETIQGRNVKFIIYTERRDRFFKAAGGEVDRLTKRATEAVLAAASKEVGTKTSGDHGGKLLKNSGRVIRGSQQGDWVVSFRHRAAEVHYKGTVAYQMPRKVGGGRKNVYVRKARNFGPTRGPIRRKALKGNPYIAKGARAVGLVVAEGPTLESGSAGFTAPGVARVPSRRRGSFA